MDFKPLFQKNLTKEQQKALFHKEDMALVLATPGSGKTTLLLERIHFLLSQGLATPEQILSLSFSKAAAKEMQHRFGAKLGSTYGKGPTFSTIHGFCFGFLQKHSPRPISLIESPKHPYYKPRLLRHMYQSEFGLWPQEEEMEALLSALSLLKGSIEKDPSFLSFKFQKIWGLYERFKAQKNLLDFDDLPSLTYHMLIQNPDLSLHYSQKFQYILVDEAQDNAQIQHFLLAELAKAHHHLFMVADDDQSIYGFRGAEPKHLLSLTQHFPKAKIYPLSYNFRSTKPIVKGASALIRQNSGRFEKPLTLPQREGAPLYLIDTADYRAGLSFMAEGCKDGKNAILVRNNDSLWGICAFLKMKGMPFMLRSKEDLRPRHFIYRDIQNFLAFSHQPSRVDLFGAVILKTNAYLSNDILKACDFSVGDPFDCVQKNKALKPYQKSALEEIRQKFAHLRQKTGEDILNFILADLGYGQYLEFMAQKNNQHFLSYALILEGLKMLARHFQNPALLLAGLKNIATLLSPSKEASLLLSTVHGAKGMEFDRVFIADCIEGQFPLEKAPNKISPGELEEERRIFYVAMTRAKNELYFVSPAFLLGKPCAKSLFLAPLTPEKNSPFQRGLKVRHKVFGQGVILSTDGDFLRIQFGEETKTFSLKVLLEKNILEIS